METDVFGAGVTPGSPTTQDEVKMLLCYILSHIGRGMTFAQIHEALAEYNLVNYFELVRNVDKLVASGHFSATRREDGAERYEPTDLARQAAEAFASALPLTVREKALGAAQKLLKREQREKEVSVEIVPLEKGYRIELAIPDNGGDWMRVSVFAPTERECGLIRRRFLNDPQFIYQGFVALLTGDEEVLGTIFPQREQLY